jgi:hypothetical protein
VRRRSRRRRPPLGRLSRLRCSRRCATPREASPALRLSGKWLAAAGFDLGQQYEVEIAAGRLTIRAV